MAEKSQRGGHLAPDRVPEVRMEGVYPKNLADCPPPVFVAWRASALRSCPTKNSCRASRPSSHRARAGGVLLRLPNGCLLTSHSLGTLKLFLVAQLLRYGKRRQKKVS